MGGPEGYFARDWSALGEVSCMEVWLFHDFSLLSYWIVVSLAVVTSLFFDIHKVLFLCVT
jgi:hypothetical protein